LLQIDNAHLENGGIGLVTRLSAALDAV